MAEVLLKKLLGDAGISGVNVSSCGVAGSPVLKVSPTVQHAMRQEGCDISKHVSRMMTREILEKADLLLVMENLHRERIVEMVPAAASRTFLLKEYGGFTGSHEIHDPIGGTPEMYFQCTTTLKACLMRVLEKIEKKHAAKGAVK